MAKPLWLTVTPMSGENDGQLSNTATEHTGREDRSGIVKVSSSDDSVSDTYSVVQTGKDEFISITETTFTVPKEGGTVEITGTSNSADLKFVTSGSFITEITKKLFINDGSVVPGWNGNLTSAIPDDPGKDAEYTFKLSLGFIENAESREKVLTFSLKNNDASVVSSEITVTQSGNTSTLSVSPESITIPASGDAVNVTVTSNTTWTVS